MSPKTQKCQKGFDGYRPSPAELPSAAEPAFSPDEASVALGGESGSILQVLRPAFAKKLLQICVLGSGLRRFRMSRDIMDCW